MNHQIEKIKSSLQTYTKPKPITRRFKILSEKWQRIRTYWETGSEEARKHTEDALLARLEYEDSLDDYVTVAKIVQAELKLATGSCDELRLMDRLVAGLPAEYDVYVRNHNLKEHPGKTVDDLIWSLYAFEAPFDERPCKRRRTHLYPEKKRRTGTRRSTSPRTPGLKFFLLGRRGFRLTVDEGPLWELGLSSRQFGEHDA